ncbi:hypothetical protein [Aurantibacter sp.]|uniref:hypothetical protein n=1 Tax=Aurantibacter sp. TaxID=2807103 RepID=UPI0035C83B9F
MDINEYTVLSKELQKLSKSMPLHWGTIQNNKTDSKINMFRYKTLHQLESAIINLNQDTKDYFKRRWFIWQCSRIDEYLSYKSTNILKNPNSKDQDWDIEFNGDSKLRFDIKGTIVPKNMRISFKTSNEKELITSYYKNQSKGVRHHIQNRLFIVHHSELQTERNMFLRCHWKLKEEAYNYFIKHIINTEFISYKTAISKCIFILESESNEFSFKIN